MEDAMRNPHVQQRRCAVWCRPKAVSVAAVVKAGGYKTMHRELDHEAAPSAEYRRRNKEKKVCAGVKGQIFAYTYIHTHIHAYTYMHTHARPRPT